MKYIFSKVLLCFVFSILYITANGQACTPNTDTVSGIEPDTLAIATVGVAYNEVIYFRLPTDTIVDLVFGTDTIPDVHLCIDSLTIDSVHGMPDDFSFACNVPWCSVLGGANGCAAISGTAQSAGIYPLDVFITIYTNDCGGVSLPGVADSVTFYYLEVQENSGIPEFAPANNFSVGRVFPNPAFDEISIPLYLPADGGVMVSVLDLEGKLLSQYHINARRGYSLQRMNVSSLKGGNFLLQLESNGMKIMRKTVIER